MACPNKVKTKTGLFTFHNEFLPLCEAKLKCLSIGQILAPVASQRDANKLMEFLKSNYGKENCPYANNVGGSYWIGLDITFEGNNQTKVFSNGKVWKEEKHGKIYKDYNKDSPTECPVALFDPGFDTEPYFLSFENSKCDIKTRNKYICLKPKVKKSAKHITEKNESMKNMVTIPIGVVCSVAALVVLIVVICVFAFVRSQNKIKALVKENKDLKRGQVVLGDNSSMNSVVLRKE